MNIESLISKIRPYVPFSALNTIWRKLDKSSKTILDVGCGKGEPMAFINRHRKFKAVGIDIFKPYLLEARAKGVFSDLILGDVRFLPFKDKSFDVTICMEVLEHLDKEDGEKLLGELERVVRKQILLTTPVGESVQDEALLQNGNPFQIHRSGWSPEELMAKGYKVRGSTIRLLAGKAGDISCPSSILRPFGYTLWIVTAPLVFLNPNWAADMVVEKKF